ncbi:MAG: hypothetical protein JW937_00365 [Candidatus Omnitrophica bacterium]|nr:hypothetical protein [Candidatus Omnitrophota bacterium]
MAQIFLLTNVGLGLAAPVLHSAPTPGRNQLAINATFEKGVRGRMSRFLLGEERGMEKVLALHPGLFTALQNSGLDLDPGTFYSFLMFAAAAGSMDEAGFLQMGVPWTDPGQAKLQLASFRRLLAIDEIKDQLDWRALENLNSWVGLKSWSLDADRPHLAVWGSSYVGKTTLMEHLVQDLKAQGVTVRGFVTRALHSTTQDGEKGDRSGFEVLLVGGESDMEAFRIADVSLLSDLTLGRYGVSAEVMDESVVPKLNLMLEDIGPGDVIILDELGTIQMLSGGFKGFLDEALKSGARLIATAPIEENRDEWTRTFMSDSTVASVRLTQENRDALGPLILQTLAPAAAEVPTYGLQPNMPRVSLDEIDSGAVTFFMLKPDFLVDFGEEAIPALIGELKARGLELVYMGDPRRFQEQRVRAHYAEHMGKAFYEGLVQYLIEGPVIPMILRARDGGKAVNAGRTAVGKSDGSTGGSLRTNSKYGTVNAENPALYGKGIRIQRNRFHASDSAAAVRAEIVNMLRPAELAGLLDTEAYAWLVGGIEPEVLTRQLRTLEALQSAL